MSNTEIFDENNVLIYNRDGFWWVATPTCGDSPQGYANSLPAALKEAEDKGFDCPYWARPNQPPLSTAAIQR